MRTGAFILGFSTILLNTFPLEVFAQGLQYGDELLRYCNDAEGSFGRGVCHGYILSVSAILQEGNSIDKHKACIPVGVNLGQIVDTSIRYIKDHVTTRQSTATTLVAQALESSFPCR